MGVASHLDQLLVADAEVQVQSASCTSMSLLYAPAESVVVMAVLWPQITIWGGIPLDNININSMKPLISGYTRSLQTLRVRIDKCLRHHSLAIAITITDRILQILFRQPGWLVTGNILLGMD